MHSAAKGNNVEVAVFLIDKGAGVSATDNVSLQCGIANNVIDSAWPCICGICMPVYQCNARLVLFIIGTLIPTALCCSGRSS